MLTALILPCSSGPGLGATGQLMLPVSYPISKPRQLKGAFMLERRNLPLKTPTIGIEMPVWLLASCY